MLVIVHYLVESSLWCGLFRSVEHCSDLWWKSAQVMTSSTPALTLRCHICHSGVDRSLGVLSWQLMSQFRELLEDLVNTAPFSIQHDLLTH